MVKQESGVSSVAGASGRSVGSAEPASSSGAVNSLIGQGSRFEGTTRIEGTLRVDGMYQGAVEVGETLVVGKPGEFSGEVKARDVVVCGTLRGTIEATGVVELQRGCRFEGDVRTRTLIVEEGVFFQGSCQMDDAASAGTGKAGEPGRVGSSPKDRDGLLELLSDSGARRQAAVPAPGASATAPGSVLSASAGRPGAGGGSS